MMFRPTLLLLIISPHLATCLANCSAFPYFDSGKWSSLADDSKLSMADDSKDKEYELRVSLPTTLEDYLRGGEECLDQGINQFDILAYLSWGGNWQPHTSTTCELFDSE